MTSVEVQLSSEALLTFSLLTAALVSLWLSPRRRETLRIEVWSAFLLAATTSAVVGGLVTGLGVVVLSALATACWCAARPTASTTTRTVANLAVLALSLALAAHLVPGFANPRVIDSAVLSPGAIPYSRYLNFDKATVGLLILAFFHDRIRQRKEWIRVLERTIPVGLALTAVIMPLSFVLGYIRWDPGWPPILLFWAGTNLFFTCIAEEAIFRGFIQRRLTTALASRRFGDGIALAVAALLFGLAHYAGGPKYVLLSIVAGLGYGWAWLRTDRIESSIAVHFFVNLVHFSLFTYPALAPPLD